MKMKWLKNNFKEWIRK
jgi:hypothetical protein